MKTAPRKITLDEWDRRYAELCAAGTEQPDYGGPLRRHVTEGDTRLLCLRYDNSAAALRLWNFLLTEKERLFEARRQGRKIVGTMKDLGTVPVLAYSFEKVAAFYPDGAWWIPCIMERNTDLLSIADSLGIDESFCPVRAMLGAFLTEEHFPRPDLLTCSVGATCDDFSVIAQQLHNLGYPICWWEMPHRRPPDSQETAVSLPGGFSAPQSQIELVKSELQVLREALQNLTGERLHDRQLRAGIERANQIRRCLAELRKSAYTARICPMPALEMLIAEMLAIHFCSDQDQTLAVLTGLLTEVKRRITSNTGVLPPGAARIFWVNPVADLQMMNLLEECGGRVCGTEYLFNHALEMIPADVEPMEALARMALADPMVGSSSDRAELIRQKIATFGAEGVVISRIPGASHCAMEGTIIADVVRAKLGIPVVEIEVPPISNAVRPALQNRINALIETIEQRRTQ